MTSNLSESKAGNPTKIIMDTEVWPIAERYKHWLFDKLALVTQTYVQCLTGTMSETEVKEFRVAALTLYVHLQEKIRRNRIRVEKLLGTVKISDVETAILSPNDTTKGKHRDFDFWAKIFVFETAFLDLLGITRIDKERMDPALAAMEEADEYE